MTELCVQLQFTLGRKASGAVLAGEDERVLGEHINTCAACREYADLLSDTALVLAAHSSVAIRSSDLSTLKQVALASLAKQVRSFRRGVIGLLGLIIFVVLMGLRNDESWIYIAHHSLNFTQLGLIFGGVDLARRFFTKRWAANAPILELDEAKRERWLVLGKIILCSGVGVLGPELPGVWGEAINFSLGIVMLGFIMHLVVVAWSLTREIRVLRN